MEKIIWTLVAITLIAFGGFAVYQQLNSGGVKTDNSAASKLIFIK